MMMERSHFGNCGYNPNTTGSKTWRIVGPVFVGLVFAVVFALVFGLLVKLIWNSLIPGIFNLKEITYWQAFGIIILAKLLFGGFGLRHPERREKSAKFFPHRPWAGDISDDKAPPRENDTNWNTYTKFWNEEGRAAFQAYMEKLDKERNA